MEEITLTERILQGIANVAAILTFIGSILAALGISIHASPNQWKRVAGIILTIVGAAVAGFALGVFFQRSVGNPPIEITSPVPPEEIVVELSDLNTSNGIFYVAGNSTDVAAGTEQGVYVLTSDINNPAKWWVYPAHRVPESGRWQATITAGDVWEGKEVRMIAEIANITYVNDIELNEDGERIVRNPDELRPIAKSKEVLSTMGSLLQPPSATDVQEYTRSVQVSAATFTNTGVDINEGDEVEITVQGADANWNCGKGSTTPTGLVEKWGGHRLPDANFCELIGYILKGEQETEFFRVGAHREFTASGSGRLFLGANDENTDEKYQDNAGTLDVQIVIRR